MCPTTIWTLPTATDHPLTIYTRSSLVSHNGTRLLSYSGITLGHHYLQTRTHADIHALFDDELGLHCYVLELYDKRTGHSSNMGCDNQGLACVRRLQRWWRRLLKKNVCYSFFA